jgi:hypothetical protein
LNEPCSVRIAGLWQWVLTYTQLLAILTGLKSNRLSSCRN